jgi:hypothetical protein
MKPWGRAPFAAIMVAATVCGTARSQTMLKELEPEAVKVAQLRGAEELGCPTASAQVLKREEVEEGAMTGWSDPPHRAEYTVRVSGCGKQKKYVVACDRWEKGCNASTPLNTPAARPTTLADQLEPGAVQLAQRRGTTDLKCAATSATVRRKETIEEGQTTGWYDPPHRAAFRVDVSGCGKIKEYVVSCDSHAEGDNACAAIAFQKAPTQSVPQLADELQPAALAAAQQRGASELACSAAVASVVRKETIEEPQTTGWYDPPHRALYKMDVTGCGKRATYLVSCDRLNKGPDTCKAGTLAEAAR